MAFILRVFSSTIGDLRSLGFVRGLGLLLMGALVGSLIGCGSSPNKDNPAEDLSKLYAEAKAEISSGSYDKAVKILEKIDARATGTLMGQQALLDLAYAQWKGTEKTAALSTIDRFIKLHPSSPAFDYGLYLKGLINFNDNLGLFGNLAGQELSERDQRAARDSYQSFSQLVRQFPSSSYAADAQLRMDYIVNSLAAHEVHAARYYLRRGAYLAAANRAKQTITEYERAPAVEEAMAILVESYDLLDLKDLRDDAARILKRSYPDSLYIQENRDKRRGAWWQFWVR
jgi:outer membrane protein assembly factor BamD